MVKAKKNRVRIAGIVALFCLSLACFTYINTIEFSQQPTQQQIYVEEVTPENPDVMPDVELIKTIVRKAFEFMSMSSF